MTLLHRETMWGWFQSIAESSRKLSPYNTSWMRLSHPLPLTASRPRQRHLQVAAGWLNKEVLLLGPPRFPPERQQAKKRPLGSTHVTPIGTREEKPRPCSQGELPLFSELRPRHRRKKVDDTGFPTHCPSQASQVGIDFIIPISTKLITFSRRMPPRAIEHGECQAPE